MRDVGIVESRLVVATCDVTVTTTLTVNGGTSQSSETKDCTYDRYKLPSDNALVVGAPEGCEASAERWYAAATADPPWSRGGKIRLWRTFPRACRAYLEASAR